MVAKKFLSRIRYWLASPLVEAISTQAELLQSNILKSQHDILLESRHADRVSRTKNPLNRFGAKYFSQTDEDGITLEIVRRLGIKTGTFVELGVGNGLENNTLILLAKGWQGFWIGAENLAFDHTLNPKRFAFVKAWVSLENVAGLMQQGFERIAVNELDVLSLDLDGNDFYIARELLRVGISPKVFILEYNAKFPPPIKWAIAYNANHSWESTDYFGASLTSFSEMLSEFSYRLVCCNAATGANAFFVRNKYSSLFADVPTNIEDIFVGCGYQLYKQWGHKPSPRTIEQMLII